jgi:hypothetical protein
MTTQTATASAAVRTCTPEGRVTRSLLGYGPLAGTVFVGSILIQGLTRRGFSIPHDDASLLANGPLGWIQVVTFLVAGAMTIAAAVASDTRAPLTLGSSPAVSSSTPASVASPPSFMIASNSSGGGGVDGLVPDSSIM